mmetsp:Transcript_18308/g.40965  ORF Transcript_18308/g.40965 Transcript_18308/m.40965 type:complete len:217 (+) Transcript_18308:642-1292(+)
MSACRPLRTSRMRRRPASRRRMAASGAATMAASGSCPPAATRSCSFARLVMIMCGWSLTRGVVDPGGAGSSLPPAGAPVLTFLGWPTASFTTRTKIRSRAASTSTLAHTWVAAVVAPTAAMVLDSRRTTSGCTARTTRTAAHTMVALARTSTGRGKSSQPAQMSSHTIIARLTCGARRRKCTIRARTPSPREKKTVACSMSTLATITSFRSQSFAI